MTDPLSVTSGAVGIVSFGLSVCQGIISYCGSWKDRDQEISSILNKAGGLRQTLQVLENFLQGDGSIDAGDGAIYADEEGPISLSTGESVEYEGILGQPSGEFRNCATGDAYVDDPILSEKAYSQTRITPVTL
ncbi:hypothetical protein M432DRAFT_586457 [Thermoascus aurantiacus ATCC 26904]